MKILKNVMPEPHIEGFIRFSYNTDEYPGQQAPVYEVLTHVHEGAPVTGECPKMKSHPVSDEYFGTETEKGDRTLLREIPIKLFFGKTSNTLKGSYQAYTNDGHLLCEGDGEKAMRRMPEGTVLETTCQGPKACKFAQTCKCDLSARMLVQLEKSDDPLSFFEFQSAGIYSYKALLAKLTMLEAAAGSLAGMKLILAVQEKSTRGSDYQPFFVADLRLPHGTDITQAIAGVADFKLASSVMNHAAVESALCEHESIQPSWEASEVPLVRAVNGPGDIKPISQVSVEACDADTDEATPLAMADPITMDLVGKLMKQKASAQPETKKSSDCAGQMAQTVQLKDEVVAHPASATQQSMLPAKEGVNVFVLAIDEDDTNVAF